MLIASLFIIQNVNASVCSFLDSDGDCITGFQEISDAQDLSLGRQINCAWSNCQLTLDVNGDGIITGMDVILIRDLTIPRYVDITGAPSVINLEFINDNTQLKITVTDSDGTPRSDVDVNYVVNEYPIYTGVTTTGADGEAILGVPAELVYKRITAKVWFDADTPKQISYTENSIAYTPVNQAPVLDLLNDITVNEGDLVIITPTSTDLNDDIITYAYAILNSNGQWQTDYNSAGMYTVTVTASDGFGLTDSKQFTLTVNDVAQNTGPSSSGGGGGGSSGSSTTCIPVITPTGNTETKDDVKIVYLENSCTEEITNYEEKIKPKLQPIAPISFEPENNAEQNINAENQNQATGFAVTDLIKQNPITTAAASIIILSLLGYGIYWFRK